MLQLNFTFVVTVSKNCFGTADWAYP